MPFYYVFNFSRKRAVKDRDLVSQAAELIEIGLWGINANGANRAVLAAGDRILIHVGAPELCFIGRAEIAASYHEWEAEEARVYPGDFDSGVALGERRIWPRPVPLRPILTTLPLYRTNPRGLFRTGVVRITEGDFERVVTAAEEDRETS